jgi:histidine phosphotransferase ChpT
MCCESSLAFGGRITVTMSEAKWQVHATSPRLRIETGLWDSLAKPRMDMAPAQVHFALFSQEISQQKRRLLTEITETDIRLSF